MSGGSYNYFFIKIDQFIEELEEYNKTIKVNREIRDKFIEHLRIVSKVCHDIEWTDSGDYEDGREVEGIKKILNI